MESNLITRHALPVYFAVSLGFSALIAYVAFSTGNKSLSILVPLSPSVLAILVTFLGCGRQGLQEMFKGKFIGRLNFRWSLVALLLIPIMAAVSLLAHSFFGGPALGLRTTQLLPQVIVILMISLGEEIGWRGFALPRLQQRFSALNASLLLGLTWGFWHYPGFLIGVGVPLELPFAVFVIWTTLATILMTWVYNNTGGSILSAILIHSAANATFNYLPLLPEWVGQTTTFSIFVGLVFVVVIALVARYGAKNLVRQ
jgi:membrane protease YdiL (CAAX protease family)